MECGYKLLLVESNPNDRLLLKRALSRSSLAMRICHEVWDGREALDYLNGRGTFADRQRYPFPDAVVTNLRLDGLDGRELLQKLCQGFPGLEIVILSRVVSPTDVAMVREFGCRYIYQKPTDPGGVDPDSGVLEGRTGRGEGEEEQGRLKTLYHARCAKTAHRHLCACRTSWCLNTVARASISRGDSESGNPVVLSATR